MKSKVLVAMSGGVDSSVAALLLLEKGFDVIGSTIAPFDTGIEESEEEKAARKKASIEDAEKVCRQIGIKHYVFDFSDIFRNEVVDYFVKEYLSGKTPNPCVHCNPIIKWGLLIKKADELQADFLATGHYARIAKNDETGRYFVQKGADPYKDQSYFLWKLNSDQLARTLFPLGEMSKDITRKKAKEAGLEIHQKADSQEVCFIRDNDYHSFLRKKVSDIDSIVTKGDIVFDNRVVGTHKGFAYYTIGQRKGIGVTHKEPLYVKSINSEKNIVEVGENLSLFTKKLTIKNVNLTKYFSLDEKNTYLVKIRFKDKGTIANCKEIDGSRIEINFLENVRAVTPGQSIAIYEDIDLIAGGVIE